MNVAESKVFEKEAKGHEEHAPIKEVLRHYKPQLAIAFFARLGGDIAFYVFTLFLLYFVPTQLGLPKSIALNAVLLGAVAQMIFIPVAGWLSDRIGRRPVLMIGGIGGALWAFAFIADGADGHPVAIMAASFVGMVLVSFMFSPLASFLPELFATRVRVTGASLGFQFAGVFGGALAPMIATGADRAVSFDHAGGHLSRRRLRADRGGRLRGPRNGPHRSQGCWSLWWLREQGNADAKLRHRHPQRTGRHRRRPLPRRHRRARRPRRGDRAGAWRAAARDRRRGRLVLPGGVDGHCHLDQPMGDGLRWPTTSSPARARRPAAAPPP